MGLLDFASAVIGLFGSSAEEDAYLDAIREQLAFLRPLYDIQLQHLRRRQDVMSAVLSQLGEASPRLRAAYEHSMAGLRREGQTAERVVESRAAARGEPERAAGARWSARLATEQAKGATTLQYASAQEERQQRLLQVLSQLVSAPTADVSQLMAGIIGQKGAAKAQRLGSVADILGDLLGNLESDNLSLTGPASSSEIAAGDETEIDLNKLLAQTPAVDLTPPPSLGETESLEVPGMPWRTRRGKQQPRDASGRYSLFDPYQELGPSARGSWSRLADRLSLSEAF